MGTSRRFASLADLFLGGIVDPTSHERTSTGPDGNLTVATDSLTTHGVIVVPH